MRGLITAIRTLTILPVTGKDSDELAHSLPWFPLVGALIGALVAAVSWVVGVKLAWTTGAGVLCVALSTILTGGLHLDGLADVFDSFGGHSRERKLEIMKDPRIGSFGVMALMIFLALKFVCVACLSELQRHVWIVLPFVVSRTAQVALAVWLPYARAEGTGRRFIEGAKPAHLLTALIMGAVLCAAISPVVGCCAMCAGLLIAAMLAVWMRKTYGGATGDLLGMGSETVETMILVGLAVVPGWT